MTDADDGLYLVTSDPQIEEDLKARLKELGSQGLVEYANSIGLYPPEQDEPRNYTIAIVNEPNEYGPGRLMWDAGLDRPDPTYLDQAREEADDDDDEFDDGTVWGELFPEGLQRIEDRDRNE